MMAEESGTILPWQAIWLLCWLFFVKGEPEDCDDTKMKLQ